MWLNCCCWVFILYFSIARWLHIYEIKDQVYYLNEATYVAVVGAIPLSSCWDNRKINLGDSKGWVTSPFNLVNGCKSYQPRSQTIVICTSYLEWEDCQYIFNWKEISSGNSSVIILVCISLEESLHFEVYSLYLNWNGMRTMRNYTLIKALLRAFYTKFWREYIRSRVKFIIYLIRKPY